MISKIYSLLKLNLLRIVDKNYDIRFNQDNLLKIIEFQFDHKKSYIKKEPRIRDAAVPWFTYPAIEFLKSLDLSSLNVFEYGSGIGTLYWKQNAKKVVTVESDKEWFNKVKKLSNFIDEDLILAPTKIAYIKAIKNTKNKFDMVIIDGIHRYACAQEVAKILDKDGVIVLDNSEWYPKTSSFLRKKGYTQLDFSGFGPVVYFTWKTSFFVKSLNNIRYKKSNLIPIGSFKHNVKPE